MVRDREAWRAAVHGVHKESGTTWQLTNNNIWMKPFLLFITIKNMRIKFPEQKHLVCFKTKRQADIQSPDPTTYQLRDRKSSNTAVYLFTNFDSQAKVPQAIGPTVSGSTRTVQQRRTMDSKSSRALARSSSQSTSNWATPAQKFHEMPSW